MSRTRVAQTPRGELTAPRKPPPRLRRRRQLISAHYVCRRTMTPARPLWHDAQASEMERGGRHRAPGRSRGVAIRCVGWSVDRPSKRRSGARNAAKSSVRYPAGSVDRPIQAPGGRRRRPSRAFFVPLAISGHRPPGASLDALLLLYGRMTYGAGRMAHGVQRLVYTLRARLFAMRFRPSSLSNLPLPDDARMRARARCLATRCA